MKTARNTYLPRHQTGRNLQPYHKRSLIWMGLAVLTLGLVRILPQLFIESFYYQGVFKFLRVGYDFLFGWSPLPMIYVIVLFVLIRTLIWVRQWRLGFTYQLTRALGGIAWVIVFFYFLWGFNYRQISLEEKLGFDLDNVSEADIETEYVRATRVLKELTDALPDNLKTVESIQFFPVRDHDLRHEVERALALLEVPNTGHVRVRQLWPKGVLLRWSTAGIYIPHALEGHIDLGLLSVQKPFTLAHEMAHGYGITDEGACNFIAWLACSISDDPWVQYSGAFSYWRYAASAMPDERVNESMKDFDPVVLRSLQLIRLNDKRYPDILPAIRDIVYSTYLERHGVKGGLKSYDYVVLMVSEYQQRLQGL